MSPRCWHWSMEMIDSYRMMQRQHREEACHCEPQERLWAEGEKSFVGDELPQHRDA
jgi:hypothetical protein